MSDQSSNSQDPRERTSTRMRFVGPPGMRVDEQKHVTTIGRYEVLKTLGKGAMGVVYKARDPLLDRVVAVKTIMSPSGIGKRVRAAYIERFEREAKAAAKMQHPSIVTIFDVGVENGAPFMVLEYLPGESLADRLDRVRLPLGKSVQIGLDLANALAFAHRQRIVHRDVKPANVLHAGENRWKLADFGIARLPDSDLTQVGIFMGTPGYSPPEAIRHGHYTPQADVFAWGAVLYELLSGRIPYEGPDTKTTNGYVIKGTASPVREHDRSIPQLLADVTMRALSPSAEERYKDGAEAEDALRRAWDECLQKSLVSTTCLTGEEVPHERVGPEMHGGKVSKPKLAAPKPPAPPPPAGPKLPGPKLPGPKPAAGAPPSPPPSPSSGKDGPVLVIESSGGVSEEEPTQVLIRDTSTPGMRSPGEAVQASGETGGDSAAGALRGASGGGTVTAPQSMADATLSTRIRPSPWLWPALAVGAVAVIVAVLLLF